MYKTLDYSLLQDSTFIFTIALQVGTGIPILENEETEAQNVYVPCLKPQSQCVAELDLPQSKQPVDGSDFHDAQILQVVHPFSSLSFSFPAWGCK